jgi:amino acid adenylation domain-containing protein
MNICCNDLNDPGRVEALRPRERSAVELLREHFRVQPGLLAIQDQTRSLTYGELDLASNLVANELHRRGLQPEEPVAILMPASGDLIVAMLGVVKAGGAYLPIEPDTPAKRLEYLLKDSGCRFTLTSAELTSRMLHWPGATLRIEEIAGAGEWNGRKFASATPAPNQLAYIIYTSGSTGQPKGVAVEHHSLTNLVTAYREQFGLTQRDRATMFSSVAFDASVAEVWPALCSGGSLVIPPQKLLRDPDRLIAWLAEEEITWTFVPTGMAEILFGRAWPAQIALRFLITGGDRLTVRPPPHLPFTVLNAYGPTENTVISTWSVVTARDDLTALPAIGRPIANVHAYVLDERRAPVAEGMMGELYLGGEQVARGYFGRPVLSAERFVCDPFAADPGARMYRTGDWVSRSPDGQLNFLGRRDDQVQVRGRRVELGEIETALLASPAVRQVCCVPQSATGRVTGIMAHIVPAGNGGDLAERLRAHLGARLPAYMMPSQFIFHERLPLTARGKVDRAALANLPANPAQPSWVDEHEDEIEAALARLWHSLLPAASHLPKDAGFAALGGDSLLLVNLLLGVEKISHQRLEASLFLMQPTFSGLCHSVKTHLSRKEFQPVLTLRKQGNRPPLFCLYHFTGDIDIYFDLVEACGEDQPVFGIRSPALADPTQMPSSIEAAASEVIRSIREVQPEGIPALVGFSWSMLLAFEVARQLAEQEGVACFTAMIGADAPLRRTNPFSRLAHFVRHLPPWILNFIQTEENPWRRILRWQKFARGNLTRVLLPMTNWDLSPLPLHLISLVETYHPLPAANVQIDLFRERESYSQAAHPLQAWQTSHLPDGGWSHWTRKPVQIHWVDGEHTNILKPPAVAGLAQAILRSMDHHFNTISAVPLKQTELV